jgi:shikimate kinase
VNFVDLDSEIERAEGQSIPEIFSQRGEDHFRIVEARLLREWVAGSDSFVMATGGGAPCFFGGMDLINQNGISIFLDVPIPKLVHRVKTNRERPLLLSEDEKGIAEKLENIREKRLACYQQAQIIVRDPSLPHLLEKIKNAKG